MNEQSNTGTESDLSSIHPGKVLREDFLTPMHLTAYQLPQSTGVPQTRISQILKDNRSISADTAHRFARFFGTSAQVWLSLQNQYDLEKSEARNRAEYENICAYAWQTTNETGRRDKSRRPLCLLRPSQDRFQRLISSEGLSGSGEGRGIKKALTAIGPSVTSAKKERIGSWAATTP